MKNLFFLTVLMSMTVFATAQNRSINQNDQNEQTPEFVQDYVDENFSGQKIDRLNKNRELNGKEYYDVSLDNGTELRFNDQDSLTRIEGENISQDVLPRNVYDYAHENYRDRKITSWERKGNQQQITLDDNSNLTFDSNGMYIGNDKKWNDKDQKLNKKDDLNRNRRNTDPKK